MKKLRALALFLAIIMIGSGLSACGNKKDEKPAMQSKTADTKEKEKKSEAPISSAKTKEETSVVPSSSANTSEAEVPAENTPENAAEQLKAVLAKGYVGGDNHDTSLYWAVSADADFGVLLAVSADETQKISFVGPIQASGDTAVTITDDSTGMSKTVNIEEYVSDDGKEGIKLTDEEGDVSILFPTEVDRVIDAMFEADTK